MIVPSCHLFLQPLFYFSNSDVLFLFFVWFSLFNYFFQVSKDKREQGNPNHPVTPRKGQKCSKRSWDGQVRKWRRQLHSYDSMEAQELAHWEAIIREKFGEVEPEPETENESQFEEFFSGLEKPMMPVPKALIF